MAQTFRFVPPTRAGDRSVQNAIVVLGDYGRHNTAGEDFAEADLLRREDRGAPPVPVSATAGARDAQIGEVQGPLPQNKAAQTDLASLGCVLTDSARGDQSSTEQPMPSSFLVVASRITTHEALRPGRR